MSQMKHSTKSYTLSHVEPCISLVDNVQEAVRFACEINDYLYGIVSKNPGRMGGFTTLPIQSPQELERTVKELGFKGDSNLLGKESASVKKLNRGRKL